SNLTAASDVAPPSAPVNAAGPPVNGSGLWWRSAINGGGQRRSLDSNHRPLDHGFKYTTCAYCTRA
nr:hypothetical protein [Tanacetum cinerariifolium]